MLTSLRNRLGAASSIANRERLVTLVIVGCIVIIYLWVKSYTAPISTGIEDTREITNPTREKPF